MAKTCMVQKEIKRKRLSKRYAKKRAALDAIIMDKETTMEDRFMAVMKLAKLPRNSSVVRLHSRCELTGAPARLLPQVQIVPHQTPRIGLERPDSRRRQVKLVRNAHMPVTDTLGDMLTRIRNGQMARMPVVLCPSSKLRKNVLEALVREGYIRGYTESPQKNGQGMLEIELKYHEGTGAIKKVERISTPGRRVYAGIQDLARVFNGLGVSILSTPRGVLSDNEARAQNVGGEILCRVF